MLSEAKPAGVGKGGGGLREDIEVEGRQNSLCPARPVIMCLVTSPTSKIEQHTKTA